MENRYLCRGKRIDNGEWVEGYLSHPFCTEKGKESYYFYAKDSLDFFYRCIVDATTICQCTGYDGIYEKDIFADETGIFVIKWSDDTLEWIVENTYSSETIPLYEFSPKKIDVIGNEIDNPELLEV